MLSRCLLLLHDTACLVLSSSQCMQPFPVLYLLGWWEDYWNSSRNLRVPVSAGKRALQEAVASSKL